ncbi:S-type pyocin domain-containing protein [Vibrio jasicida]|uniref:S-type pyocin domain-containing protein n=1 Tax=Vibrio jasicida TaxID=766224 RepID=UPI002157C6EE|nr:S-type pyocin domain-containing protein [Vibrio jasicida]
MYWKLADKIIENQYIIYLERQITREELDNLSEDWLSENGIKLDIPTLFDVVKQPEEERSEDNNDEAEAEQTAATHIVVAGETWQSIAELYGMGAKALLSLNPVFEADPLSLAIGDEIVVTETQQQQIPDKKNTFPPLRPQTYNNIRNSHYQHSDPLLGLTKYRAINAADCVEGDVAILNLKDVMSSLVFAKSCTRPKGCIEIGDQQESISNFGPWSFFFAQANATPTAFMHAIQATQAQMAMGSSATVVGSPEQTQQTETAAMQLDTLAGTLKDKIVEGYRWQVEGIGALFAMQQSLFGDNTQYTDQDLRQVTTAQSRIRVHITEPKDGEFYPHVQGYHIDDTRIPIKYVKQGINDQLSVAIEKNGPTIYWTPEENGEASWQTTPDHSDGFEKDDILVTPIHSDGDANVTVTPAPEEKDWRDAILVFPESSGIAPLYVVYDVNRGPDGRFTPSNEPKPSLERPSLRAETKRQIEAGARKDANGQFIDKKNNIIEDWHYGHKHGLENRRVLRAADEMGMTQAELNDFMNTHSDYYQIEDAKTNLSHAGEKPGYDDLREIERDMKRFLKDRSQ